MNRVLARLVGLTVLWAGVELLERVAFAAGVDAAAAVAADVLDDLEAVDCSDVVAAHLVCCGGPLDKARW